MKYIIVATISMLILLSCEDENVNVTLSYEKYGMIEGRIIEPVIINNKVEYNAASHITVYLSGDDYSGAKTWTTAGGSYSFTDVPIGAYYIESKDERDWGIERTGPRIGITVTPQMVTTVPDINIGLLTNKSILYGKAYLADGITPLPINSSIEYYFKDTWTGGEGLHIKYIEDYEGSYAFEMDGSEQQYKDGIGCIYDVKFQSHKDFKWSIADSTIIYIKAQTVVNSNIVIKE
jgi:hypothetical protein